MKKKLKNNKFINSKHPIVLHSVSKVATICGGKSEDILYEYILIIFINVTTEETSIVENHCQCTLKGYYITSQNHSLKDFLK